MSAVAFFLWATLSGADSWIAQTGVTFVLILLLVGGILLIVIGIRDVIRDFRRFLHERSHKDGHAPV